jgi:hypothetical protein
MVVVGMVVADTFVVGRGTSDGGETWSVSMLSST